MGKTKTGKRAKVIGGPYPKFEGNLARALAANKAGKHYKPKH